MRHSPLPVAICLLAALGLFLPGINWGLPSRAVDPYLFGDREPWPGRRIAQLAPAGSLQQGADVDPNPIGVRDRLIVLNENDRQRAEILVRYRLYSHQPDEMITFRSLARIRELGGDPRLYQYGGLWIYPVGAMLQLADIFGLVELRGDPAFYYDRPEAFGRFYIVARVYTAFWGVVATWAVYWIVRRLAGSAWIGAAGAVCFAAMPVVVNMAHEAKPHLPGLALTLLATIAAAKYVESGRMKWAALAGALCGAAFGMVISALLAFAILPVMVFLRPAAERMKDRLVTLMQSGAIGVITYVVFNPYVAINAVFNRDMLRSNLENSTDMYRISLDGIGNALRLIVEGASPIVVIGGVIGIVVLLWSQVRYHLRGCIDSCPGRGDVGWLLLAPTVLVLLQFVLLAGGKPAEYARFALLPDTFLVVSAFAAIALLRTPAPRATLAVATAGLTIAFAVPYVLAFVRDSGPVTSRMIAAQRIEALTRSLGIDQVILTAEPAPYSAPPIDLFRHRLILAPAATAVASDAAKRVLVTVDPSQSPAPISWADVRFAIVPARPTPPSTLSSPP